MSYSKLKKEYYMLEYNEVKPGKVILYNGEPHEVIESHVARTQQRKPQNQTKLRSLFTGKVFPATFHTSERIEEADMGSRPIKFVYGHRGEFCFTEVNNPSKRFFLDETLIGEQVKFLKANTEVEALTFAEGDDEEKKIIGIRLPIKVELKVSEAPPVIKGNTAAGGNKQVVLETGAVVSVPLFIEEGNVIRINTQTGEYTERV